MTGVVPTPQDFNQVSIIGAGTMGHGLALVHAIAGCRTKLFDIDAARLASAHEMITGALATLVETGAVAEDATAVLQRIDYVSTLESACGETSLIIEAVVENADLKRDLYAAIDQCAPPDAVLASNTSFLDPFPLIPVRRASKALVTHWYTPPYIVDLVDIVPGPACDPALVERLATFYEQAGKVPLRLPTLVPGYIANRIQGALNLECLRIIEEGWADAAQIDLAVQHGLAARLLLLGHMRKMDFTGLEMIRNGLATRTYQPPEATGHSAVLDAMISGGRLGIVSGAGFYDYPNDEPEQLLRQRDKDLLHLKAYLQGRRQN